MCCTDIPNVSVLDVEGTDGAEVVPEHLPAPPSLTLIFQAKGERDSFESRVCLFSLSISDVLIFNVHENIMNLHQASGQVLLKTVFRGYFSLALLDLRLANSAPLPVNAKNMTADPSSPSRARVLLLYVIRLPTSTRESRFFFILPSALRRSSTPVVVGSSPSSLCAQRRIWSNAPACQPGQRSHENAAALGRRG